MPLPTEGLTTDEELVLRAGAADYDALRAKDQSRAGGNDGAFGPTDRWTLNSASVDFVAQGVEEGMVARLDLPGRGIAPDVQFLAVDSASGHALTLRRLGGASGEGQPPAAVLPLASIKYVINTFRPQILRATQELEQRFGIDDLVYGRRFADLYDPAALRDACTLTVLWKLCRSEATTGSPDAKEGTSAAWFAKGDAFKAELDEVLARLVVRFAAASALYATPATAGSKFGMRISR